MIKKYKIVFTLTVALLLSLPLVGCASGIPQEQHDSVKAQLAAALAQVTRLQDEIVGLQDEIKGLEAQHKDVDAELKEAQAQVAELQSQISDLQEKYELVGETPAETAEKIVSYYHETHTYSIQDFYVCSDMASDVWNMLAAQGINAVIQIGNIENGAVEITSCDHAWVLAEVVPGEYLALETTGGQVVPKGENPLYYQGWSFVNPRDFKQYQQLRREYNIIVGIINWLVLKNEDNYNAYKELVEEYNSKYAGKPVSTDSQVQQARISEKEDRCQQMVDLIQEQKTAAENIYAEMEGLAAVLKL